VNMDNQFKYCTRPMDPENRIWSYLNSMARLAHERNKKWWYTKDGVKLDRNKGELLALIHSEISEVLEGVRKDMPDEKLPHRKAEEVELVDALIRIFDYAGAFGLDISGAMIEKNEYNAKRADHTYEHREGKHGKKF